MSKIKSITRKRITDQRLYNLSVKNDESFVADGIVVHNCKTYVVPNLKTKKGVENIEIVEIAPSAAQKKSQTL